MTKWTAMKWKSRLLSIGVALGFLTFAALGFYTETRQGVWQQLRSVVAADDTPLDGTTAGFTLQAGDRPGTAIEVDPTWNTAELYFYGTDAADEVCNYKLYAYKANGPGMLWVNGAFTLGTAVEGTASTFFADTITETDGVGITSVGDSTNNRVAVLKLGNTKGIRYFFLEIDIPASTQVASASAMITGY